MARSLVFGLLACTAAIALAGCASHLIPDDVTRVSTVDIVARIRCEARAGVAGALADAAAESEERRRHVQSIVAASTIGYDFTFQMEESNAATLTELSFEKGYSPDNSKFLLTLSGGWGPSQPNLARQNTRIFRVFDKLDALRDAKCDHKSEPGPNLMYPIAGSTGMEEVVRSYIELEALTDLGVAAKTDKEIIAFSDSLRYTTTLDLGTSLQWAYSSAVGTIKLTKATAAVSAHRKDVHKVDVALARDVRTDPDRVPRIGQRIAVANEIMFAKIDERRRSFDKRLSRSRERQIEREILQNAVQAPTEPSTLGIRDRRLQNFLTQRSAVARNRVLFELERRRKVFEDSVVTSRILGTPVP